MIVKNVEAFIGILFVGMKLFKTAVAGIVKDVAHAGIGGNGIVKDATAVAMVSRLPANIAEAEGVDFQMIKEKFVCRHFLRDKIPQIVYSILQKL